MRASSCPARGSWLSDARGGSHAKRCGEPAKLAAARPTDAPPSSSSRVSEAAAMHSDSNDGSSQVICQWGPGSVWTSTASTTSRPRAGS